MNHPFRFPYRPGLAPALALLLLLAGAFPARAQDAGRAPFEPAGIYLTWQRDPTTTMTIDWHTAGPVDAPAVQYRADGAPEWLPAPASSRPFPFSDRFVHRVELAGLRPAGEYEFRFGETSRVYRFRTMPAAAERPIRFAVGGDTRHNQAWMEQTNRQARAFDVDFVLFGGDLAYANGQPEHVGRWYEWFDAVRNTLITESGRVIPVIVSIGNHEVRGGNYRNDAHALRAGTPPYAGDDSSRARIAPFFYRLFATPGQPGYRVLDFGDYLSVVLLDSDHSNPIDGEQAEWLESVLSGRTRVPHVFPIYHVPAYPSVRAFDGPVSARVREHWVPLFERYGVRVVFENHDHAYKRSHPLRQNEIRADGVVYLGDGCWGTGPRQIGMSQGVGRAWYLDRAESVRHFILVTLQGAHRHFMMVDENGNVFDEYPRTPNRVLHHYPPAETGQPR